MAEPKWTPGLWAVSTDTLKSKKARQPVYSVTVGYPGFGIKWFVCTTDPWCGDPDASEANAHLIAAAPELYVELENLVRKLETDNWTEGDIATALMALAKARGEVTP